MSNPEETQLIREATSIFLQLRDDPDNAELRSARDAFLARGEAERVAYSKLLMAWNATDTGPKPGPNLLSIAALVAGLGLAGYMAYAPLRIALVADFSTSDQTGTAQLGSGDRVTLDAGTALVDITSETHRGARLMQGAAFFDVRPETRPFQVTAGDIEVTVTGTAFEVGTFSEGGIVTVTQGRVEVTVAQQSWTLSAGQQFIWSDETGAQLTEIEIDKSVGWRKDLLVSDGLTFGQLADVLDRRLPGEILIPNARLAATPVVGTFDLTDPSEALDLLARLTSANVLRVPSVVTLITP